MAGIRHSGASLDDLSRAHYVRSFEGGTGVFHNDSTGNPAGGTTQGIGYEITWQDGPLDKVEQNGAFVIEVINACIDRIKYYNDSRFRCRENSLAITDLESAVNWLERRQKSRRAAGVQGTHGTRPEEGQAG